MFNQANTIFLFYSSLVRRFFFPDGYRNCVSEFQNRMLPQIGDFFLCSALIRSNFGSIKYDDVTLNTCDLFFSRLSLRLAWKKGQTSWHIKGLRFSLSLDFVDEWRTLFHISIISIKQEFAAFQQSERCQTNPFFLGKKNLWPFELIIFKSILESLNPISFRILHANLKIGVFFAHANEFTHTNFHLSLYSIKALNLFETDPNQVFIIKHS